MLIDRLKVRIAIVSVVLGALFATSFMAQSQSDAENSSSALNKQVTTGESCVKDTSWMRRNHMELLKHDRDRTLRQGIRPVDGSIKDSKGVSWIRRTSWFKSNLSSRRC